MHSRFIEVLQVPILVGILASPQIRNLKRPSPFAPVRVHIWQRVKGGLGFGFFCVFFFVIGIGVAIEKGEVVGADKCPIEDKQSRTLGGRRGGGGGGGVSSRRKCMVSVIGDDCGDGKGRIGVSRRARELIAAMRAGNPIRPPPPQWGGWIRRGCPSGHTELGR